LVRAVEARGAPGVTVMGRVDPLMSTNETWLTASVVFVVGFLIISKATLARIVLWLIVTVLGCPEKRKVKPTTISPGLAIVTMLAPPGGLNPTAPFQLQPPVGTQPVVSAPSCAVGPAASG